MPETGQSAPDDTRERLLRVTLRLIGEEGAAAVTNRRVARAAGISLGSLTYHFASHAEMLREALLLYVHDQAELLGAVAEEVKAGRIDVEQASAGVEAFFEADAGSRIAKLELYLRAARDDELTDAAAQCFEAYDDLASSALAVLGVESPDRLAPAVVALVDGLQLRRFATGTPAAIGPAEVLMLLVRGARAGG